MKVLLDEDDVMIGENTKIALEHESIAVDWAKHGKAAEAYLASYIYDAMLLDLGLPEKDGMEVLRSLRASGSSMPVLVVTARDNVSQRVLGLNNGADDYLVKPFDMHELIARLHAIHRRTRGQMESVYRKGDVFINPITRQVLVAERQVLLSSREWILLDALISRPGAILSRDQLASRLFGLCGDSESNAVEVYIHGLRKKLGALFITNIRGVGYLVEKS